MVSGVGNNTFTTVNGQPTTYLSYNDYVIKPFFYKSTNQFVQNLNKLLSSIHHRIILILLAPYLNLDGPQSHFLIIRRRLFHLEIVRLKLKQVR